MKILYHHRVNSRDGQYVHIDELTAALEKRGHEIIMAGPRVAGEQAFGGESRFLASLKRFLPKALYELLEFAYSAIDYVHVARAIRRHRPDVIYERYNLLWISGAWARKRFDIPLITEVNAPLYEERSRYGGIALKRLARTSERMSWRAADRIVTVTHVLAARMADAGIERDKIVVTPNGVNEIRFVQASDRAEAKRRLRLDGSLVIGFVGFAREWHGLDRVIELLARDEGNNTHFVLAGDGDVCQTLCRKARASGVSERIHITGILPRDEVGGCIQAFDIALQPAVVDYASPLKLFEYMASGAAIVAPNKANIREILVDGRDALLFEPSKPRAFSSAIDRLSTDRALRERLGEGARATIRRRNLTWDHNARAVEDIAGDLTAETSSPMKRKETLHRDAC
jgi:glycosyltransferase involved in cell wall biosynthesis